MMQNFRLFNEIAAVVLVPSAFFATVWLGRLAKDFRRLVDLKLKEHEEEQAYLRGNGYFDEEPEHQSFHQPPNPKIKRMVSDEYHTIRFPGGVQVAASGFVSNDLGVRYANDIQAKPFVKVFYADDGYSPAIGQYAYNDGNYSFAKEDIGKDVLISYVLGVSKVG